CLACCRRPSVPTTCRFPCVEGRAVEAGPSPTAGPEPRNSWPEPMAGLPSPVGHPGQLVHQRVRPCRPGGLVKRLTQRTEPTLGQAVRYGLRVLEGAVPSHEVKDTVDVLVRALRTGLGQAPRHVDPVVLAHVGEQVSQYQRALGLVQVSEGLLAVARCVSAGCEVENVVPDLKGSAQVQPGR